MQFLSTQLFLRLLDILLSILLMILFSPVVFITALFLFITQNGQVFFIQKRPGLNCRAFKIIKFKTMIDKYDSNGQQLPDSLRLTYVGKLVRRLSLDELPQLLNVLFGQMSLVGPRPLLMEYLSLYSSEQIRRQSVRPGITGWAQINGRNAISWDKRLALDIWYVDNYSISLYFKILFYTLIKVIKREGITGQGSETMTKFKGST